MKYVRKVLDVISEVIEAVLCAVGLLAVIAIILAWIDPIGTVRTLYYAGILDRLTCVMYSLGFM